MTPDSAGRTQGRGLQRLQVFEKVPGKAAWVAVKDACGAGRKAPGGLGSDGTPGAHQGHELGEAGREKCPGEEEREIVGEMLCWKRG